MDQEEAITMFCSITDAPRGVAEHVLDAHHWDLNNAVSFFLESGGVGHGNQPAGTTGWPAAGRFGFGHDEPADETAPRPALAAALPRSQPIEIPDDDDDLQVLASNLARRPPSWRMEDADDEVQVVGSIEDEFNTGRTGSRRQRRNRPRGAGSVDRDLQLLGQRFGALDDEPPAAAPSRPSRLQQQQREGHEDDAAPLRQDDADMPALPDDVDMDEQRMLMAALTGGAYEGALPDFANDPRFRARALSPGAQERQKLRQEQDAAYYESLQADMEREAAESRAKQELEEQERAEREAQEAEERRQREEEARVERTISSKQAALPPEPADGGDGVVNVMIRLPSGSRIGRRFHKSDRLQALFNFVDVQRLDGLKPNTYHLVMQYPRKTFEEDSGMTLAEAGLTAKQEALFLEMK